MAGILISPTVEQKILGRKAAWKTKNGDVKFKDILRQRCRLRIKERREHLISHLRGLNATDLKAPFTDIVRDEYKLFVKEFERSLESNGWDEENWELPRETLSEEDEWLMKRFDLLFDDDILADMLEEVNQVVCPLCLKGCLKESPSENKIKCDKCLKQISACSSLPEIHSYISRCLEHHSKSGCCSNFNFFTSSEDETQYLYVICSNCSYFDIVG